MDFIKSNAIQILIGIFSLGGIYARFVMLEKDVEGIKQREDTKIEVIDQRLNKYIKRHNKLRDEFNETKKCNH